MRFCKPSTCCSFSLGSVLCFDNAVLALCLVLGNKTSLRLGKDHVLAYLTCFGCCRNGWICSHFESKTSVFVGTKKKLAGGVTLTNIETQSWSVVTGLAGLTVNILSWRLISIMGVTSVTARETLRELIFKLHFYKQGLIFPTLAELSLAHPVDTIKPM